MKGTTVCDVCERGIGGKERLELIYYSGEDNQETFDICMECGKELFDQIKGVNISVLNG